MAAATERTGTGPGAGPRRWRMWAQDRAGSYWHPGDRRSVPMYGGREPTVAVEFTEDVEGGYWGWLEEGTQIPVMIYPSEGLFSMCFPYGYASEVARGRGETVRLRAVRVDDLEGDEPRVILA